MLSGISALHECSSTVDFIPCACVCIIHGAFANFDQNCRDDIVEVICSIVSRDELYLVRKTTRRKL